MKKIISIFILVGCLNLIAGCNTELIQENEQLKARIVQLEGQLKQCGCGEVKKEEKKQVLFDPSVTNPDDNQSY